MTMVVARSFEDVHLDSPAVLSIGTFDGVHRGHRFLLEQARDHARDQSLALVVVTFDPCPAIVLRPSAGRYQINSPEQKLKLLADLNATLVVLLRFTHELSLLTANQFMDELEARLKLKELWAGEDFRFGHDRGGNPELLAERSQDSGFTLHVVSRRMDDRETISSSRIRHVIADGEVEHAIRLLGYPFRRECTHMERGKWVAGGDSSMCSIAPHLLLPADGVYAIQSSAGTQSVALVSGSAPESQLTIKGAVGETPVEIEFIHRLATTAEYLEDPVRWDASAQALLSRWQRPSYTAIGRQ